MKRFPQFLVSVPFASVRNVDEDISSLEGVDVLVMWLLTDSWFSSS